MLARELWVVKDRQIILEAVLARHGLDLAAEIAAFQPEGAIADRLAAERAALLERLITTLAEG
ncbi:hypothetical protein [Sandaracinobacteroides saxicola]|uniref:Uncharacterized protein n=1 Tax=Sandaracinobacteroides saxicola TaxID=2759707 RepID=A0A7G5IH20_9SPHN|nr:hypothetical protein [Sandaracinobacteroides saxicola]QMW22662.1 hypothetical protein H3309_15350 [Sandaracinobacteroides saxicola]